MPPAPPTRPALLTGTGTTQTTHDPEFEVILNKAFGWLHPRATFYLSAIWVGGRISGIALAAGYGISAPEHPDGKQPWASFGSCPGHGSCLDT